MTERCPSIEEILRTAEIPEPAGSEGSGDPRMGHVRSCPRCRGIVLSFADFRAQSTREAQPGEDAAVARLRERVRSLVAPGGSDAAREPAGVSRRLPGSPWGAKRGMSPLRFLIPAFGAAAILIGSFLIVREEISWNDARNRRSVEREIAPPATGRVIVLETPRRAPGGGIELSWRAVQTVDSYRVRFLDAGFREVATLEAGSATSLTIPSATWSDLMAANAAYWQMQGTVGGDPFADSVPTLLPDSVRAP